MKDHPLPGDFGPARESQDCDVKGCQYQQLDQQDWSHVLGGSHRVQRNRDSDVVGVGIAAGHGTHCRLRDGAPEEQETQQAIEKPPHRRCGKQGKRGVDTEGCTDIASGHNGEEQRGISDVESGTGEGTLDIRASTLNLAAKYPTAMTAVTMRMPETTPPTLPPS